MSDGQAMHKIVGSLTTGAAGAWFVALGELDVDPVWSFAKKMAVIVVGGLVAGVTHQLGTQLAGALGGAWAAFRKRLRKK